jgi:hypothetical protein
MPDATFDEMMFRAAARAPYPATPDMRARVLTAIAEPARPASALRAPRLAFAATAVAAACGVVAALGMAQSRGAIADFFGVEGSKVERLPTAAPGATATPFPSPSDLPAGATRMPFGEAAGVLGGAPSLPAGSGEPRETYVVRFGMQAIVILRYDGFDMWQARLEPDAYLSKGAPQEGTILDTAVAGRPAIWVSGPHVVQYVDPLGRSVVGSQRTVARNTLIWGDGTTFFRIETDLPLDEALTVAESVR